jgi:hypothetical protein
MSMPFLHHGRVSAMLALVAGALSVLATAECAGPQLGPPGLKLRKVSSTRLPESRITMFRAEGTVDLDSLAEYPLVAWETWSRKTWSKDLTADEKRLLTEFLERERENYTWKGQYPSEVRRIDGILVDLSRWPLDSCRIAYLAHVRPGSPGYLYGTWVYFYYLDTRNHTLTEITNAFR